MNVRKGVILVITFKHVTKRYGETAVVDDINFNIKHSELFVLVGPSGSGKTTTLKMINYLIPLTEGDIQIGDKSFHDYDLYELRWNIGYVLQQIALFPNMTVEENIALVPEMKGWDKSAISDRVTELLELVRLNPDNYRNRDISELSGGQQQRIGVARALAANPDILLMDEPFSALDPISRYSLQEDLIDLQNKLHKTIVFVTHDMQEALRIGDRICIMNKGHIEQIGTPDQILNQPATDFVRTFIETGLPNYKASKTIADVIASGYVTPIYESVDPYISVNESLDTLLERLVNQVRVIVISEDGLYQITQSDYLRYLHEEAERSAL